MRISTIQKERKYTFLLEKVNESSTYGYTDSPFLIRQIIETIRRHRDSKSRASNFKENNVYVLPLGRYMILLRIISKIQMRILFLDYILPCDSIISMDIFTQKEIEALLRLREWMMNTNTELDDELAAIASFYN